MATRAPKNVPRTPPVAFVQTPSAPPGDAIPEEHKPYIPATTVLPELTAKVFVVGIILSWIMASANAYLGLYAALTVSAAIPASVISMAVLRFFKNRNILENNLIQTTASAGESVVAGIIFVLPALLFLGYWNKFHIWETMIIAAIGGSLGVVFTIPLRRAFIVEAKLLYPEGVATVEVLKSGEKGGSGVGYIALAAAAGALMKFLQGGLGFWRETAQKAVLFGKSGLYMGTKLAPALVGVGFIVGLHISSLIFGGGLISYLVAIPIHLAVGGCPECAGLSAIDAFGTDRSHYIRFIGVGAMATGGIWTLVRLRSALARGFRSGIEAYQAMRSKGGDDRPRTERDINMRTVLITLIGFTAALVVLFTYFVTKGFTVWTWWWVGLVMGVVMLFAGFLFSAVAGYLAGVVGSSNNPISGTAIGTILFTAGLLFLMGLPGDIGPAATILIGSTVASAAAIAGDNMQDLKAGYLLGGTPRNLQIMQMVGAAAAALIIPFVLLLLDAGFGIGPGKTLEAAQASLMFAVAGGIFRGRLTPAQAANTLAIPWPLVLIGVGIAVVIIAADAVLQARGAKLRLPVMAVAVGMYLPLDTTAPIFIGGAVAYAATVAARRKIRAEEPSVAPARLEQLVERRISRGVLFSSGLIAGEALMGILLAAFIAAKPLKNFGGDAVTFFAVFQDPRYVWTGLLVLAYIVYLLYYVVVRREKGAPPGG